MTTTKTGKISRIVKERGFGFITPDETPSVDHFFNVRGMHAASRGFHDLSEGDRVTFIATLNDKGPRAIEVRAE
jgi:cold shock CspA family protein